MISILLVHLWCWFWDNTFGLNIGYGTPYWAETWFLLAAALVMEIALIGLGINKLHKWAEEK